MLTDKNYPADVCRNVSAPAGVAPQQGDALYCSDAFFPICHELPCKEGTCVAQRPGCGSIGKPCCVGHFLSLDGSHDFLCNEGATCPYPSNQSTLCVA